MAGHSHWANIKNKKQSSDAQKSKLFSKVSREIMMAITLGNGVVDPDNNIHLRGALDKAKEVNMPKENIDRLIERMKDRKESVVEVVYEALVYDGASLVIKTATDNSRRTHAELATFLGVLGAKLVEKGAVLYLYDLCGAFLIENKTEEEVLGIVEALEGVDMEAVDSYFYVYVLYDNMSAALTKAKELGISKAPELVYRPKVLIPVSSTNAQKMLDLMASLEDMDDVQEVFTNAQFPSIL